MSTESRLPLFLISFAALFFEVLVIRWLSSEIVVFGYFKNLVLMGAFVGLGLGCASAGVNGSGGGTSRSLIPWFPALFLVLVILLTAAPYIGLTGINFVIHSSSFYWLGQSSIAATPLQLLGNVSWVVGIFFLVVALFDSLGQLLGRELAKHTALTGYAANLGGSLAGVLAYTLMAFLRTFPPVWLLVGFASLIPFFKRPWQIAAMLASLVLSIVCVGSSIWSPYYRIETAPWVVQGANGESYRTGTNLVVNHSSFQRTVDLSPGFMKLHPEMKQSAEYITYNMPYEHKQDADEVLVVGAGSGNDVAAALRNGAKHVDAVEIDPTIMDVGRTEHPERPYSDRRVTEFVNDARNYLASTKRKYDLIVFGFLDSSVNFAMLSSVRLDNFLYTIQNLQLVTQHLKPDGIASLSFAAGPPWLRARLYQMVQTASGQTPVALASTMANRNSIIILWGPGLTEQRRSEIIAEHADLVIPARELSIAVPLCTDDWPFLYQKERAVTTEYVLMLAILLLIAGSLTVLRFRLNPGTFFSYAQFLLLGAAFLLLETRAMLAVAILFGSTWLVNSIVISLILAMALFANWIVQKVKNINQAVCYAALFISLLVLYLVPLSTVLSFDVGTRIAVASLVLGLPFLFAGLIFSSAFAKVEHPEQALGINIFGALIGGCLEYLSIVIGIQNLALLALALYVCSAVSTIRRSK